MRSFLSFPSRKWLCTRQKKEGGRGRKLGAKLFYSIKSVRERKRERESESPAPKTSCKVNPILHFALLVSRMASLLSKTRAVAGRVGSRSGFQQAALILASRRKFSNEPGTVHPRPISPHVEIYAFPTTALTSIANRGTGVGLSIGKNLRRKGNQCL